jgi:hypothetical protein
MCHPRDRPREALVRAAPAADLGEPAGRVECITCGTRTLIAELADYTLRELVAPV